MKARYWDAPDLAHVSKSGHRFINAASDSATYAERNVEACKESVLLFLLKPDSIIPLLVRVPVTSKGRFLKYSARLLSTLTPISSVVTEITLEEAANKGGEP